MRKITSLDDLTPEERSLFEINHAAAMKFEAEYSDNHLICPNCGSGAQSHTGLGVEIHVNDGVVANADTYKDENLVKCCCGWEGIVHDLVSKTKALRNIKVNTSLDDLTPKEQDMFHTCRKAAQVFEEEYYAARQCCPNCSFKPVRKTYNTFLVYTNTKGEVDNADTYKDTNEVECCCGWVGIIHDLLKD